MKKTIVDGLFTYLLLFSVMIIMFSCNDKEILLADNSTDLSYFPVSVGHWTEYEVDSIVHYDSDDFSEIDTAIGSFHFYIREIIDSSFIDGEKKTAYVISRYRRDSDTLPWTFMNIWTANLDAYSAQRVEDNIRFIRLGFPIRNDNEWNGNAYNFYLAEEYIYEDIFEAKQIGNFQFDSTVTVIQNDFVSQINRIFKKEIYSAQVGLVYKQLDSVNTKNTVNGTIILNGLEYKLSITNYN